MNLEKLKPWNWFKHEEGGNGGASQVPVSREQAGAMPVGGADSLMSLHREMDRWFDDAFRSFGMPWSRERLGSKLPSVANTPSFFQPRIDVAGDDNCYEISLDVPGLTESDLTLQVRDDVLTIKGQKEERKEEKGKQYYRVERSYGSFQRMLDLPDDANTDEIKAKLDKGVLRLVIPRRAGAEQDVKRITITS